MCYVLSHSKALVQRFRLLYFHQRSHLFWNLNFFNLRKTEPLGKASEKSVFIRRSNIGYDCIVSGIIPFSPVLCMKCTNPFIRIELGIFRFVAIFPEQIERKRPSHVTNFSVIFYAVKILPVKSSSKKGK